MSKLRIIWLELLCTLGFKSIKSFVIDDIKVTNKRKVIEYTYSPLFPTEKHS